jgi:hypothetical protein
LLKLCLLCSSLLLLQVKSLDEGMYTGYIHATLKSGVALNNWA